MFSPLHRTPTPRTHRVDATCSPNSEACSQPIDGRIGRI
ncbi:hypothetical protein FTUN_1131 [Frigoriglobus tundricola]|uniref:Uncharacterized protein n=1 Tax=Frigoriglobus tundricola TaxID=2774151 RepID=A0A6M5YK26_9BACT|nr:hypothetical protein FTUN_1131 [Frigoriglobus tundricola]